MHDPVLALCVRAFAHQAGGDLHRDMLLVVAMCSVAAGRAVKKCFVW